MGPLVFAWPSPILVLLASLLENFVGFPLRGPLPTHRLLSRRDRLLSYGPPSLIRSPLGGNFFVCVCFLLWVTGT